MEVVSREQSLELGDKFYFTGIPCHRGHIVERYTSTQQCKLCVLLSSQTKKSRDNQLTYRKNNKEKTNAYFRQWSEENKERRIEYRNGNKEHISEYNKQYAERNRGKRNAIQSKRRAVKKQATPIWADLKQIEQLYCESARNKHESHVDHIIPLQNDIVCGLHVEINLQILTSGENGSKSNMFDQEVESKRQFLISTQK